MQKAESIMENNFAKETIRKSSMAAEDTFDYLKITANVQGVIPCTFEETLEEITFEYDLTGLSSLKDIERETEERKRQFLINFVGLYQVFEQYHIDINEKNIFYDENMLPYVKARDLYGREGKAEESDFLYAYKCIAGGILSRKYKINQVLDSGLEILKKDKSLSDIVAAGNIQELVGILRSSRADFIKNKEKKFRQVSKVKYSIWRTLAIVMLLVGIIAGGLSTYYGGFIIPEQKALVMANERFITKDYVGCIDSVKKMEVEDMDTHTKYILAVSYASTESFKQEEISEIISKLSINSNEKELEYWIYLGRLDVSQAENIALALSDDKLLIYAYMKEIDILENRNDMDGEEKKSRLDTLNSEIKALGEKYTTEEQ
ncbi:MAG: hypothetical protein J6K58_07555 [Lachnospiraceae bacterium]|nr:hypothetical protein [Lachnospiraceae bacterium]